MPLDPAAKRLLAMLGAGPRLDPATMTADARRRSFAASARFAGAPPPGVAAAEATVAGAAGLLDARLYASEAEESAPRPGLVWFHGGGLVAGDLDTHDTICRHLAAGSGCRVLSVAYRLAPEHPFPAAAEDAIAALADVLDRAAAFGFDPERIAVGGDSAGGGLATVAARAMRDRPGARPALQALLCPVLDARGDTDSRRAFANGFGLDAALMARDLADLGGGHFGTLDLDDPRLSPLHASGLGGLPPALIHTAQCDPLCDEGAAYAEALRRVGVVSAYRCHAGMIHHFYGLTGAVPAAASARDSFAQAIRNMLSGSLPTPS